MSMLEIYNERIRDLLVPTKLQKHCGLRLRDTPETGVYVENLKKVPVSSIHQIKRLVDFGTKNRTVAATNMNEKSSRSHTIFTINLITTIMDKKLMKASNKISTLRLVDLAGSERIGKSNVAGERLTEGTYINKSLSALGSVINTLAKRKTTTSTKEKCVIPYRNSVLTHLMRSSLGGNSRTTMIATISSADTNFSESLSTLRYSNRAKQIKNHIIINTDPNEELERLRKQLRKLKEHLRKRQITRKEIEEEMKTAFLEELKRQRVEWDTNFQVEFGKEQSKCSGQPYLSNLNEDNALTDKLRFYLKEGENIIGCSNQLMRSNDEDSTCDIILNGAGIIMKHAIIQCHVSKCKRVKEISLITFEGSKTLLNGIPIQANGKRALSHGDRILFGHHSFFVIMLFVDLGFKIDWEYAMREANRKYFKVSERELVSSKVEQDEMEIQLRSQKDQLESLHRQISVNEGSNASLQSKQLKSKELDHQIKQNKNIMNQKNREMRERARIDQQLVEVLPLVQDANTISNALNKDLSFQVKLLCKPVDKIYPYYRQDDKDYLTEVVIRIFKVGYEYPKIWTLEIFLDKVYEMKEMYQIWLDEGEVEETRITKNPFSYIPDDYFLGRVKVQLESLYYILDIHDRFPIVDYAGKTRKLGCM